MEKKNIMDFEHVLPEDFDGTFRFTNDSDEDFIGRWNSKEYVFPAHTTSPMLIPEQTALEIQQIRKKFAKDWAEREYQKSDAFRNLLRQERNADGSPRLNSFQAAGSYGLDQLIPYIQRCLKPLPNAKAKVVVPEKKLLEDSLHRDEEGELVTKSIDKKLSLREKALKGEKL